MYFLANASPPKNMDFNFTLCRCIGHMMYSVLVSILCDLDTLVKQRFDPKVKAK